MSNKSTSSEKNIELYHPAIEEIMGTPPSNIIIIGSGSIFIILLMLFISSFFFTYPDKIHATATLHGNKPLEILVAPVSGKINFTVHSGSLVKNNDTIFELCDDRTMNILSVPVLSNGVLEIDPLVDMQKYVQKGDTIGLIWAVNRIPTVCSIRLLPEHIRRVKVGNPIRIDLELIPNHHHELIEAQVQSFNTFNSRRSIDIIALLPICCQENLMINGDQQVSAEIIVGEDTFFERLINPFRGLRKKE